MNVSGFQSNILKSLENLSLLLMDPRIPRLNQLTDHGLEKRKYIIILFSHEQDFFVSRRIFCYLYGPLLLDFNFFVVFFELLNYNRKLS